MTTNQQNENNKNKKNLNMDKSPIDDQSDTPATWVKLVN